MVKPFHGRLDGRRRHHRGILSNGSEVHEGQTGDAAVVVADDGHVVWHLHTSTYQVVEHPQSALVVRGNDSSGQGPRGEDLLGCASACHLCVLASKHLRELTQVVSPHRVSVTASSLQCTRPAAAVDIGNAPVAQGYKVRDGLTQAAAVIASHHIDAWGWRRETYRND